MRPISRVPKTNEAETFKKLWKHYKPKIRKMVETYAIPGAVGCDVEDLVEEHAQEVLLQAIRTHKPKRAYFSTHFYTLFRNHLIRLKQIFPRQQFLITGVNHKIKKHIRTRRKGSQHRTTGEVCFGATNLEARMQFWRGQGYHLAVKEITPSCKYRTVNSALSLDDTRYGEGDELQGAIQSRVKNQSPVSESEIISMIHQCISDQRLQKITTLLFSGHKVSGKGGIMKRMRLERYQYERDLQRIRMLLLGQFRKEILAKISS